MDCKTPTEAALLPVWHQLAVKSMQQAQKWYTDPVRLQINQDKYWTRDWVFMKFPHEEMRKKT